jgi:hypothetical protein
MFENEKRVVQQEGRRGYVEVLGEESTGLVNIRMRIMMIPRCLARLAKGLWRFSPMGSPDFWDEPQGLAMKICV